MNILASYEWLKEYVDLKQTPEEFASRVSLSGPGIERLYPQAPLYDHLIVGQVVSLAPHPRAEKLRVVDVAIGEQHITIVCGGSNVYLAQWVVVALPGARVRWHGEGDFIELKPMDIRGISSEGMICAANEIGLFDAFPHKESEILDLGIALRDEKIRFTAGKSLASVLDVETDVVMDVEITTNRTDAMGIVGFAREASAILKRPFTWKETAIKSGKNPFVVHVEEKKLCPRFTAVRVDGVKVGPSPWWLKRRLLSAGQRPINNVVDITNYVLLELGRPMHVFDAHKIKGDLQVRRARVGESLKALDGKTYALAEHHLIVADEQGPQSIAGIMGGEESGATSDTTSVIFECAVWDPTHLRRTARELNLFSDAQALFEKGLSTESTMIGLARAIELCLDLAHGSVATHFADVRSSAYKPLVFSTTLEEVRRLMGVDISLKEIQETLERLGFALETSGHHIQATVPWWRDHDIEDGRDLIEEIARVYGYGNIPALYPPALTPQTPDPELLWERRVRTCAKAAGYTELYTYSFISHDLADRAGFDVSRMLRVQNPLSDEFVFMRTSLLPSMLQVVSENQERFREQRLFEVANVYYLKEGKNIALPEERPEAAMAVLGSEGVFAEAKGFVEYLIEEMGIESLEWRALPDDRFWHPGRAAQGFIGEHLIATVGEVHPLIAERFKIEQRLAFAHLPLAFVFKLAKLAKTHQPVSLFPEAKRDIAFLIDRDVTVHAVEQAVRTTAPFLKNMEWFDTYRGEGVPEDKKSLAFHLTFGLDDRTLETSEVDAAMENIGTTITSTFGAEWRR